MGTWRKVLYIRQPYPDNYSGGDKQFLKELRKNVSVVSYGYVEAVIGAFNLIFHVDCVVLFFILFEHVLVDAIPADRLASTFFSTVTLLYLLYCKCLSSSTCMVDDLYTSLSLISIGFGLTPVIRTLTNTISTDTVYAMSFLSSLISCIFHDYGVRAPIVSLPLSVSSGLCSAIFLLSRLKDNTLAFTMLAVAFVIHACSPGFRNLLFAECPKFSSTITAALSTLAIYLLNQIHSQLSILLLVFQIFILFVCPYILVTQQLGKRNIHGPWDEAVPSKR